MLESNAISDEVKNLFDTIHNQATQYNTAFNSLEHEISEFHLQKEALSLLVEQLKTEVSDTLANVSSKINDILAVNQNKIDKTLTIYNELQPIRDLKESLIELNDKFTKQSTEFESFLNSFKNKSNEELESTLINIKLRIEKEVDSEVQKSEMRLAVSLRQLESKIISLDQKHWTSNESLSREIKSITSEIDLLRSYINSYRQSTDEVRKKIENQFAFTEKELSKKIEYFESIINSYLTEVKSGNSLRQNDNSQKDIEKLIDSANNNINKLDKKFQEIENKGKMSRILSIIAIIGLVILVIKAIL